MDKKISILTDNYVEESELIILLKVFKNNKSDITIISAGKKKIQAMEEVSKSKVIEADLLLEEANSKDYDVLILPGGIFSANNLRINEKAQAWAVEFLDSGRLVAASGYASLLLVSADLVEGKKLTSPIQIQDDIRNAGGEWTNRPVVIDKNLITGRGPDDCKKFSQSILSRLG